MSPPLVPTPLKSYLGRDNIRVITLFELGLIRPKNDSLRQRSCLEKHRKIIEKKHQEKKPIKPLSILDQHQLLER